MARNTSSKKIVLKSYTFKGTNKVIHPGDSVLIKPLEKEEAHYVGRVEKLEENNLSQVEVSIRWYYRPEDVYCGRRPFHGRKELFLSDHYDIQNVHTIDDTCKVHTIKEYYDLQAVSENDFFWRMEYVTSTREFIPKSIDVYCICEMPDNPDELMVMCDDCEDWFHPSCIGITVEEAVTVEHYFCSMCASNKDARYFSNTSTASPKDEDKVEPKRRKR